MFLFLDAAALSLVQESVKQKNTSIVKLELCKQELMTNEIEIHRSYAMKLEDLGKLNDLNAEHERDHFKQNIQTLTNEVRKWKEELKQSASVLGNTIRQNKEEKVRLNDEMHIAKISSEALKQEILTNHQELDRIRLELKLG